MPTTLSSVDPTGRSTTPMGRRTVGSSSPASIRAAHSGHRSPTGSQPQGQPSTTSISGNREARARTAVDLAVPFSPRMSTPPSLGLTTLSIRAFFIRSWPTMAEKG